MAERAAHLVDHVLPDVPMRQWVLSWPYRLRYLLAWDHDLCRALVAVYVRAVLGFLRQRARRDGVTDGRSGAVVIIQRFGGALNLNVHVHALVVDGVFAKDGGVLRFLAVLTPRPRINLVFYYGVLAPRAPWRAEVVASAASQEPEGASATEPRTSDDEPSDGPRRPGAYLWADLMRRTFGFDVLQGPRCGGRLRLLALIEHASAVERILRHLGLPRDLPEPRPARAPPNRIQHSDVHWDKGVTAFDATC